MTTPSTTSLTMPRAGGIIGMTAWTGGKATILTSSKPAMPLCFCPVEFTPTSRSILLARQDGNKDFSLHNFEDAVEAHFFHTGMDSVFLPN